MKLDYACRRLFVILLVASIAWSPSADAVLPSAALDFFDNLDVLEANTRGAGLQFRMTLPAFLGIFEKS